MKLLTKVEEMILLSIWRLQDNAYGVSICEEIEQATGRKWNIGAIYAPLARLEKNGFVRTKKGEPVAERGGRSKVFYTLTALGKNALRRSHEVNEAIWSELPPFIGEEKA